MLAFVSFARLLFFCLVVVFFVDWAHHENSLFSYLFFFWPPCLNTKKEEEKNNIRRVLYFPAKEIDFSPFAFLNFSQVPTLTYNYWTLWRSVYFSSGTRLLSFGFSFFSYCQNWSDEPPPQRISKWNSKWAPNRITPCRDWRDRISAVHPSHPPTMTNPNIWRRATRRCFNMIKFA